MAKRKMTDAEKLAKAMERIEIYQQRVSDLCEENGYLRTELDDVKSEREHLQSVLADAADEAIEQESRLKYYVEKVEQVEAELKAAKVLLKKKLE